MPARFWDLPCAPGYQQHDAYTISSWHQLPLFPSASAKLAPPHREDGSNFSVNSRKTSEPWARTSEGTATQGNAHGIYMQKYLTSLHCWHVQRPRVEDSELPAALWRKSCRAQGLGVGRTTGDSHGLPVGFPGNGLQSMRG